jgi:shikimate kinase
VWLRGDLRQLTDRARALGQRPMLASRGLEEVEALYRAREPYYQRAHLSVDTTDLGPDAVVARLLTALRQYHVAPV